MPDRFRAAAAAAVDALFPPDPGALRLFAALRATLAGVLTLIVVYALGSVMPLPIADRVLGFAIALFTSASVHDATPRARLVTIALTPFAAFAAVAIAGLASHRFGAEAVALLGIVFAAIYGAARGARWGSLGSVALIAFFFSVVSQPPLETLPMRFLVLCLSSASVALVRFVVLTERPEVELARLRRAIGLAMASVLDDIASAVGAGLWSSVARARLRWQGDRLADMTAMAQARQNGVGERLLLTQLGIEQIARRALISLGSASDKAPIGEALTILARALRTGTAPAAVSAGPSQLGANLDMFANLLRDPPADDTLAPAPSPPPISEDSGLAAASRAAAAAGLAIIVSGAVLPTRWYWAAFAAFAMFQGTRSRGESIAKEVQYFIGTLSGVVVGMFAGYLLAGHEALQLFAIIVAVFLAFQASAAAYGAMMLWLTIIIGLMFGLLGYFVADLLMLRLEETAIGAICGVVVGLVFPMRSALATRKAATKAFFQELGRLVECAIHSLIKPPSAPELPGALIAIEQAARDLRTASSQEAYGLTLASNHAVHVRLLVVDACEAWARELGRVALMAREAADERLTDLALSIDARIQASLATLIDAVGGPGRETDLAGDTAPPVALPGGTPDYAVRLLLRIDAALQHLQRN